MIEQAISTLPASGGPNYWVIAILLAVISQIVMQLLAILKKQKNDESVLKSECNSNFGKEEKEKLAKLYDWHVTQKSSFGWEDRDMLVKLHELHNVKDEDGLPVWYVNRTLRKMVADTSETLVDIKDILRDLNTTVKNNTEVVKMAMQAMIRPDRE